MVVTVAVVVATHNLAYGVGAGVLTAMVPFARRVAHVVEVTSLLSPDGTQVVHTVDGQVFFASSNDLVHQFDCAHDPPSPGRVVLTLTGPPGPVLRMVAAGDPVRLDVREASLEEIFLDFYGQGPA